jgi:tRNA/rRNA methyltransferase
MLNFGFSKLWLVNPWEKAFRDAKSAMGAADVLKQAQVVSDRAEALGDGRLVVATSAMQSRTADIVQRDLVPAALALRTHLDETPAALLFGPEKTGLSKDDLSFCDWILTIPTNPGCPSMNLGQAVAICCYELARRSRAVPELKTPTSISAQERGRILDMLLPILSRSGFVFEGSEVPQTQKLRRWISRLRLAPKDALLLQGMLRQIEWKLDHPD